jgi:hypothetical protein
MGINKNPSHDLRVKTGNFLDDGGVMKKICTLWEQGTKYLCQIELHGYGQYNYKN